MAFNVATPDSAVDPSPDWAGGVVCFIVVLNLITAALNGLCIILSIRDKKLRAQQSIALTLNLAVTDFVLAALSVPIFISNLIAGGNGSYVWSGGQLTCAWHGFVAVMCCCNSIVSLGIIAIERYLIVVKRGSNAFTQFTRYNTHIIAIGWVVAIIVGGLPFVGVGYLDLQQSMILCVPRWYSRQPGEVANALICFIVLSAPLNICFWCYYQIFAFVKLNSYAPTAPITVASAAAASSALVHPPALTSGRGVDSSQTVTPPNAPAGAALTAAGQTTTSPKAGPTAMTLTIQVPLPSARGGGGDSGGGMSGSLLSPHAATPGGMTAAATAELKRVRADKKEREIARKMFVLAAAFALCWGPYGVLEVIEITSGRQVPAWFDAFCICCGYTNSLANAILFLYVNPRMKRVFFDTLRCGSGAGGAARDGGDAVIKIDGVTSDQHHNHAQAAPGAGGFGTGAALAVGSGGGTSRRGTQQIEIVSARLHAQPPGAVTADSSTLK